MKYFFIYFSFNKGEIYEGQHEAVVSKELYEEILRVNKLRSREKYDKHYLLSGKVVCGHCGAKYRYQKWGKRLVMYCNSQQSSRKRYVKDPKLKMTSSKLLEYDSSHKTNFTRVDEKKK